MREQAIRLRILEESWESPSSDDEPVDIDASPDIEDHPSRTVVFDQHILADRSRSLFHLVNEHSPQDVSTEADQRCTGGYSIWSMRFGSGDLLAATVPVLVDQEGGLNWGVPLDSELVTIDALSLTIEDGYIVGSIDELTINITPATFEGDEFGWEDLFEILGDSGTWLSVLQWGKAGIAVLQARYRQFESRGADPVDIYASIIGWPLWDLKKFCLRFGLSETDAVALLDLYGFRRLDSGEYERIEEAELSSEQWRVRKVLSLQTDAAE